MGAAKHRGGEREREGGGEPGTRVGYPSPIIGSIAPDNCEVSCRQHITFLPSPFIQHKTLIHRYIKIKSVSEPKVEVVKKEKEKKNEDYPSAVVDEDWVLAESEEEVFL